MGGKDDMLVRVAPLLQLDPWRAFLARVICEEDIKLLRADVTPASVLGENCSQFGEIVGLKQGVGTVHLLKEPEQLVG